MLARVLELKQQQKDIEAAIDNLIEQRDRLQERIDAMKQQAAAVGEEITQILAAEIARRQS